MRIVIYIIVLALLLFAPLHRLDVALLEPAEVLAMRVTDSVVELETDIGHKGQGKTVDEAIKDLKENTPGVIYLDTAKYLLLTKEATACAQQLWSYLRRSIKVCMWDGQSSVSGAAEYLKLRTDLPRFDSVKNTYEKS